MDTNEKTNVTKPSRRVVFVIYAYTLLPVVVLSAIDLFSLTFGSGKEVDVADNYFMAQLSIYWGVVFALSYLIALILISIELIRGNFGLLKGVVVVNLVWVLIASSIVLFDFSQLFSEFGVAVVSTLFSAVAFATPYYFIRG